MSADAGAVPFLYCIFDDDDDGDGAKMVKLEPETTVQRVIVWRCPSCGQVAREYPNYDAGSSNRIIVWDVKPND